MKVRHIKSKPDKKKIDGNCSLGLASDPYLMGKLSFDHGKFYFEPSKRIEADTACNAGLKHDAETLRWVTRKPDKALALRRFADQSAELKFKQYYITEFPPPEQIQYPDHLSPRPSQIESAWWCVTRSPVYCADEAGLGKTIMSALCMNSVPGRAIVICPPHLVYNWHAELNTWLTDDKNTIAVMEGGKSLSADKLWDSDVVILPDSLIINPLAQSMIKDREWTWLFVDEAHRYKEATTQRTKALIDGITPQAERICYLSGTPIPNGRPIELYPLLNGTAPESILWRNVEQFGLEFCNGKRVTRYEGRKAIVNWDFSGASNLKQFRKGLRSKFMIRHLKRDVLTELPPKQRKIIFLDCPATLQPFEKKVLSHYTLDELLGEDHTAGDVAAYRREVGEAKINPAYQMIEQWLDENPGKKAVVFAHHIEVVEQLANHLKRFKPIVIRGGIDKKEKFKRVQAFQSDPERRLAIGNMEAMGTGSTMTAAEDVFVVESSWVPGINDQAEDRLHRLTQLGIVYCRYLVLRGSLDERMLYRTLEKQESISAVMD